MGSMGEGAPSPVQPLGGLRESAVKGGRSQVEGVNMFGVGG